MDAMRANQAEDIGSGVHYSESDYRETRLGRSTHQEQRVLEGDYVVQGENGKDSGKK
jgi:hypothetical protein